MKRQIQSIIEGESPIGAGGRVLAGVLRAASWPYGWAMRARAAAYRAGALPSRQLPCPVVCIGNLTVGGSGKTPVVAALARMAREMGLRPAIISRGYGAAPPPARPLVVSDGRECLAGPREAGDEPALLARLLDGVPIIVFPDRHAAGALAVARFHPDMILLDDGFQHLRLRRDLDIVLLDASLEPASAARIFPRGPLREPPSALGRAGLVLLTRLEHARHAAEWKSFAQRWAPGRPILESRMRAVGVADDCGRGALHTLDWLRGRPVFAFSGIARPEHFTGMLRESGADIRGEARFTDHHAYTPADLESLAAQARRAGAECLIATDKDAVKIADLAPPGSSAAGRSDLPISAFRIEAEFLNDGAALFRQRLSIK